MDAGITAHAVLTVVTPFLGVVALRVHASLVAGQEWHASLRLVRINPVVWVPVAHQLRIVTVAIFVEVSDVCFDAAGADNHVWIILQDLKFLVPSLGLSGQLEVQDYAVTNWQIGNALLEFLVGINGNLRTVGQPALQCILPFLL